MPRGNFQLILHYRAKCIGCGACTLVAPEAWTMEESDGKANLVGARLTKAIFRLEVPPEEAPTHREASEACPVGIIQVV